MSDFISEENVIKRLKKIKGHVGFYYKNLITGEIWQYNSNDIFIAASIIKLPLAIVLERAIISEKIIPETILKITKEDKVEGCGFLSLIPEDIEVSIRGLINNMLAISDNTATNKLIELMSLEGVAAGFEQLGLKRTRINRLLCDEERDAQGINNFFALDEIMMLLENLHSKSYGETITANVLTPLKLQQVAHKIPCRLAGKVTVANKTGEDENTSHDVAIVYGKDPFLLGIAANDTDVYEIEDAMRNIALELYELQLKG